MNVAVLISGGKDSALALHRVLVAGYEVKSLVTMIPKREDSWMFHYPNIHLAHLFAEAVEIPYVEKETSGEKERELEDLKDIIATLNVDALVSGAIASHYQKSRIEKICMELGIKSLTPLWEADPLKLLKELIELKFRTIITGVYALGFDESWLGRQIDTASINSLLLLKHRHQISLLGEGGEYETLVLDAPFFKSRIEMSEAEKIWENQSGWLRVKKANLIPK